MIARPSNWGFAVLCLLIGSVGRADPVRVLTYDAMLGKGSLGEFIAQEFPRYCAGCSVKFVVSRESGGLLGRLRADRRRSGALSYDVVLGIGSHLYRAAHQEKLLGDGRPFDTSPFAIMVDKQKFPPSEWPTRWSEVPTKLRGKLLLEDPRLASEGVGWFRTIFEQKLLTLVEAQALPKTIFPSWSAAYEAFTAGRGVAVWSYRSSEAYHRCHDRSDRYVALPLKEGYPQQEEWVAPVSREGLKRSAQQFLDFVVAEQVQAQIAPRNWMYPVRANTPLPNCYSQVTEIHVWGQNTMFSAADLRSWSDQWNL
ncbi:MAG: substrate-binding domain-containing protein [Bdellovibrionales bacterium]|nr:substrate-binding domain-containing protein [Bdellovibrionales bacterium]